MISREFSVFLKHYEKIFFKVLEILCPGCWVNFLILSWQITVFCRTCSKTSIRTSFSCFHSPFQHDLLGNLDQWLRKGTRHHWLLILCPTTRSSEAVLPVLKTSIMQFSALSVFTITFLSQARLIHTIRYKWAGIGHHFSRLTIG